MDNEDGFKDFLSGFFLINIDFHDVLNWLDILSKKIRHTNIGGASAALTVLPIFIYFNRSRKVCNLNLLQIIPSLMFFS
jgi:hypothetical protein